MTGRAAEFHPHARGSVAVTDRQYAHLDVDSEFESLTANFLELAERSAFNSYWPLEGASRPTKPARTSQEKRDAVCEARGRRAHS
jgi:hypothetical protein